MKEYLRWIVVGLVVLYAVWIAFPVLKAFVLPDNQPNVPVIAQDNSDFHGGVNAPMDSDSGGPTTESIQGDTAVDAIASHNTPVIALWGAVIILYVAAAF